MSEEQEETNEVADIAIIDADSIIYMIAYTEPSPANARKRLDESIENIVTYLEVPEAIVFIKGEGNFRFEVDIEYKANRANTMEPEIKDRVERLYEHAREMYTCSDNAEADDYCFVYAMEAYEKGLTPIICHIDKDLNMIPGIHYNFKKQESYFVEPKDAYVFLMTQLLTGDNADNIKGLHRIGPSTANRILLNTHNKDMLEKVIDTWQSKHPEDWKDLFYKCANCILIRSKLEDFRPLSFEELMDRLSWDSEDTVEDYTFTSRRELVIGERNKLHMTAIEGEPDDFKEKQNIKRALDKLH